MLLAALSVAGIGWLLLQRGRGVVRAATVQAALPTAVADHAGERLTVVQVSSEHCSSCGLGARVWRKAIDEQPGVAFVEIDAADHMELVRDLGVLATPTALLYDGAGVLRGRVTGAPTPKAAAAAVAPAHVGVSS